MVTSAVSTKHTLSTPSSPTSVPVGPPKLVPTRSPRRLGNRKPVQACLFCRGRKIACGPPVPGGPDNACNQCQRRSLKCEFPCESRRGAARKAAKNAKSRGELENS
ncbi:hypothetical protein BDZ89DRAFT_958106 [Hymenopellis radicata]|nr:hypothetical protein BDZ89DRAFT_958106 [Hymenopellis radicata]